MSLFSSLSIFLALIASWVIFALFFFRLFLHHQHILSLSLCFSLSFLLPFSSPSPTDEFCSLLLSAAVCRLYSLLPIFSFDFNVAQMLLSCSLTLIYQFISGIIKKRKRLNTENRKNSLLI